MRIIGGKHRNRKLVTPKGTKTRPTPSRLRESLFNICQGWIDGAQVLDLFSGSGSIGLEALSRGAASAVCVDRDREAQRCIKQNAKELREEVELIGVDVYRALEKLKSDQRTFDLIYCDPPYAKGHGERLLDWFEEGNLLAEDGILFIEESVSLPAPKRLELVKERTFGGTILHHYRA